MNTGIYTAIVTGLLKFHLCVMHLEEQVLTVAFARASS